MINEICKVVAGNRGDGWIREGERSDCQGWNCKGHLVVSGKELEVAGFSRSGVMSIIRSQFWHVMRDSCFYHTTYS